MAEVGHQEEQAGRAMHPGPREPPPWRHGHLQQVAGGHHRQDQQAQTQPRAAALGARPQLRGEVAPHRHAQGEQEHGCREHVEVLRQGLQGMGLRAELARHPAESAQPPGGQAAEGRQEGAQV